MTIAAILRVTTYLLIIVTSVQCHSWLACTDYTEKNGATWKPDKCRGFSRGSYRKAPKNGVFGGDSGFDHSASEKNPCQVGKNDNGEYNRDHPKAVYYPGQQVILVHPMKNHGADVGCTNIHIPDTGSWIYRSQRNPSRDPSLSEFKRNLVFDLGKSPTGKDFNGDRSLSSVYPKPGYQNAPKFCDNTDKAMGTYAFNVPKNLSPGKYTFIWLWAFNSARNLYSSCFEVEVVRNKASRDSVLKRNGFRDMTEPCGGMTSNPNVGGNSNRGCTKTKEYSYAQMPSEPQNTATKPWYFRTDTTKTTPPATTSTKHWGGFTTRSPFRRRPTSRTTTARQPTTTTLATTTEIQQEYYYRGDDYSYGSNADGDEYYYYDDTQPNEQGKDPNQGIASVDSDVALSVMVLQFGGEIPLPSPRSTAIRRHYAVEFGCDVQAASFWNSKVTNENELTAPNSPRRRYEIMQEGHTQLQKLYLYYHVNYKERCDMVRFPPHAKLVKEEYKNV